MKFKFRNMILELNIFNITKHSGEEEEMKGMNFIESLAYEHLNKAFFKDSLESCLLDSITYELEGDYLSLAKELEVYPIPVVRLKSWP